MADTKITVLTAITTVDPAVDVLPIVDISDTTMAASGTTKKITTNQILGAGGTATLASATITGDLTVATNTLKVVSASNRVLINQASALQGDSLEIAAKTNAGAISLFGRASDNSSVLAFRSNGSATQKGAIQAGDYGLQIVTGSSIRNTIDSNGVVTWSEVGGVSGTAMTLNSTGLGLGIPPAYKLDISGTGTQTLRIRTATSGDPTLYFEASGADGSVIAYDRTNGGMRFDVSSVTGAMRISTTGNVGVGVTPSGSGGCLQLKSGITFPATQVASSDANTLDDYEEGTWTPTIKGTSTAGTGTYSVQVGTYTKVGRVVYFQGRITWSAHTGTGDMQIAGIPFTALSTTNSNSTCNFGYVNNLSLAASSVLTGFVFPGTNDIGLYQYTAGGGVASTVAIDTAADIMFSGFYFV
jgi:hypothetical protein